MGPCCRRQCRSHHLCAWFSTCIRFLHCFAGLQPPPTVRRALSLLHFRLRCRRVATRSAIQNHMDRCWELGRSSRHVLSVFRRSFHFGSVQTCSCRAYAVALQEDVSAHLWIHGYFSLQDTRVLFASGHTGTFRRFTSCICLLAKLPPWTCPPRGHVCGFCGGLLSDGTAAAAMHPAGARLTARPILGRVTARAQ